MNFEFCESGRASGGELEKRLEYWYRNPACLILGYAPEASRVYGCHMEVAVRIDRSGLLLKCPKPECCLPHSGWLSGVLK